VDPVVRRVGRWSLFPSHGEFLGICGKFSMKEIDLRHGALRRYVVSIYFMLPLSSVASWPGSPTADPT
jgi:hypothetical protein